MEMIRCTSGRIDTITHIIESRNFRKITNTQTSRIMWETWRRMRERMKEKSRSTTNKLSHTSTRLENFKISLMTLNTPQYSGNTIRKDIKSRIWRIQLERMLMVFGIRIRESNKLMDNSSNNMENGFENQTANSIIQHYGFKATRWQICLIY